MNEITDKTQVVTTRSTGNYYVTVEQAEKVIAAMSDKSAVIRLDGNAIATNDITGVVSGERIRELDRKKQGDFECSYGHWHQRGEKCGHAAYQALLNNRDN